MMIDRTIPTKGASVQGLPAARSKAEIQRLRETIRVLEIERKRLMEKKRWRLFSIGAGVSLLIHISLMTYLALVNHGGHGMGSSTAGATYEMAILNENELTDLEQTKFDELPAGPAELDQPVMGLPELDAIAPATGVATASPGSVPTLGASGDGSGGIPGLGDGQGNGAGLGLGGGGGGTSFFGISSKGTRFAYIVDISGSMGQGQRLATAMRELSRSIDGLPDYSSFYILLFSDDFKQPPMQKGWTQARKTIVKQFIRWLTEVEPTGGTQPRTSFLQVFSLDVRPDVIFFLTDGEFGDVSAEEIAALNSRGKKSVINTIQFGDPGNPEMLKAISAQSGGLYRFVAAGG